MTQTEASRAALSTTTGTTEQVNPLTAYSRSLHEFHQKMWNESRRKSEIQSRGRHEPIKNPESRRRVARNSSQSSHASQS